MSKRRILLTGLIFLLLLSGIVTFKSWAGEEILPYTPPGATVWVTPNTTVTVGEAVTFEVGHAWDKDLKVTWEERDGKKYNFQREVIGGTVDGAGGEGTFTYTQPGTYPHLIFIWGDDESGYESTRLTFTITVVPPDNPEDPEDPDGGGGGGGGGGDEDEAPTVNITSPANNATFITDNMLRYTVTCSATVTNASASDVSWTTSSANNSHDTNTGEYPTGSGLTFTPTFQAPAVPSQGQPIPPGRPLTYTITAKVETTAGSASASVTIKQDLQDILRQEYIDYKVAATPSRAPGNLTNKTQHRYLNYGNHSYWIVNWTTNLHSRVTTLDTAYTAGDLNLTSAYRNPRKQVLLVGSRTTNSFHVYGAAIDYNQGATRKNYNVHTTAGSTAENILYDQNRTMYWYPAPWPPPMIIVRGRREPLRAEYRHGHVAWSN